MSQLSALNLPIKNPQTGNVQYQVFNLGGDAESTNFRGTTAQWNALSLAEKARYKTCDFVDDFSGYPIDNDPTEHSNAVVRSGGIYNAMHSFNTIIGNVESVGSESLSSYTQGDLIGCDNGHIYIATLNIAVGDVLNLGINIAQSGTLIDQINTLRNNMQVFSIN